MLFKEFETPDATLDWGGIWQWAAACC